MNTDTARDDLAYLRALVETPGNFQRSLGESYFAAGLCYGVQMLLHAGQAVGWIQEDGLPGLAIGLGPTVVFLGLLTWIIARDRAQRPAGGGMVARAVGAVFGAVGIANLALVFVIGWVAWREQSLTIWLIYPCAVMVLQGMAWMVVYALRRRPWFAVVATGWFATGIGMALAIGTPGAFIAVAGFGFLAFMLVPGWVLMRQPRIG